MLNSTQKHSIWLLFLILAAESCALRKAKTDDDDSNGDTVAREEIDIVAYTRMCKSELGLNPDTILDPWNCLDGTEIETKIENQDLNADNYAKLKADDKGCDNPSWLSHAACDNYAFIQKRILSPDVTAILLCRMRSFASPDKKAARLDLYKRTPTLDNFKNLSYFDSLGIIMSNASTGKTCFFDRVGSVYGGYVPSPDDDRIPTADKLPDPKPPKEVAEGSAGESDWKRTAREVWKAPREVALMDNCVYCHDNGPWKHSPWIEGLNMVPKINRNVPFIVVGRFFSIWRDQFPLRAVTTDDVLVNGKREPQACTTCHRMGTQGTCDNMMNYAAGTDWPVKHNTITDDFKFRNWMPPRDKDWDALASADFEKKWKDKYTPHMDALACCCKNPKAKGCSYQNLLVDTLRPFQPGTDTSTVCVK